VTFQVVTIIRFASGDLRNDLIITDHNYRCQKTYWQHIFWRFHFNAPFRKLSSSSQRVSFSLILWRGLSQTGSMLSFVFSPSDCHLTIQSQIIGLKLTMHWYKSLWLTAADLSIIASFWTWQIYYFGLLWAFIIVSLS